MIFMELTKPPLSTDIQKRLVQKQSLSQDFVTYLQDIMKKIIKDEDLVRYQFSKLAKYRVLKIKEQDILEKVSDRYRWPKEYEKNQSSLEVITFNGKTINGDFKDDNFADSFENTCRYLAGEELVLHRCQTLMKNLTYACNLFSSILGRKLNFTGYLRQGNKKIKPTSFSLKHHIIIKNAYGLLKCSLNGRIKILKKEGAVFVRKGTKIKIEEIKEPTFYIFYHL